MGCLRIQGETSHVKVDFPFRKPWNDGKQLNLFLRPFNFKMNKNVRKIQALMLWTIFVSSKTCPKNLGFRVRFGKFYLSDWSQQNACLDKLQKKQRVIICCDFIKG